MGSREWWVGLGEALDEAGFEWWRGILQLAGAAIGFAVAWDRGERYLIFMLIGAIYGTVLAGLGHHWREIQKGDRGAWRLFLVYVGAAAGFTYRFYLSGGTCNAARLVFSPFYAGVGALAGLALASVTVRQMAAVLAVVSLTVAGCGPSAADKDEAAAVLSGFQCTSDYLDRFNVLNPAPSMVAAIPAFAAYLKDNGVSKRHVATIRSMASARESQADAFADAVAAKMSEACPDRKPYGAATGFLMGMIAHAAVLRDAGV